MKTKMKTIIRSLLALFFIFGIIAFYNFMHEEHYELVDNESIFQIVSFISLVFGIQLFD